MDTLDSGLSTRVGDGGTLELANLPMATLLTRQGVCIAANPALCALVGLTEATLVGHTVTELIERIVTLDDRRSLDVARNYLTGGPAPTGEAWARCRDAKGVERRMRIAWHPGRAPEERLIFLLDAEPEAFSREVSDTLARAAGQLGSCASEKEVLWRAVEALSERGFLASTLIIEAQECTLAYGPSAAPGAVRFQPMLDGDPLPRPDRTVLERFNPAFLERRAAYHHDGMRLVREAFPLEVSHALMTLIPAHRMVQAPLFVDDAPYGALIVTGAALSPLVAGAIELFAELVARAIENVRLRQQGVERERLAALGEAAAVMAHEVRNPLGAILNALAVLERTSTRDEDKVELVGIIREEADRLERLVVDLLELGRPLMPRARTVRLHELVTASCELLVQRGELTGVELQTDLPQEVYAWVDPDLAQLAILNILRNAIQASPHQGIVRVRLETCETEARVLVEDAGPGFSAEVLSRLGEPFLTTRATGTGLGLALVRRVMDASDGRLEVGRSSLGGASVILGLRLPTATVAPAA